MPSSGLFITLYDEDTLKLYLHKGIYGFLMPPVPGEVSRRSRHYHALADYGCIREGAHVFFFLKRKIVYAGQIIGSKCYGSFYLNGDFGPLGKKAKAKVCWDESKRSRYEETSSPGIFQVPEVGKRCQPYLIQFKDKLGIKGKAIQSDQLYWELGKFRYPLPSNAISGMSFCTLTPGETDISISLLTDEFIATLSTTTSERIELKCIPPLFAPEHGVEDLEEALERSFFMNEAHLESFVLANPAILPQELQPTKEATICRQVPVSPFKPFQMDRANICYYSDPLINKGTIPNTIIELKINRVGKSDVEQVVRYLKWLYIVLGDQASQVKAFLAGPSFARNARAHVPHEYRDQVRLVSLL